MVFFRVLENLKD